MGKLDFESSREYYAAKGKFGVHPTDYDLGPTPWLLTENTKLPHPAGKGSFDSTLLIDLFDPAMGMTVEAYRTMSNLDLSSSNLSNLRIRRKGFTLSRLQAVLRPNELKTVTEKKRWKQVVRPLTLPEMIGSRASSFYESRDPNQTEISPDKDPDIVLRLPSFSRPQILDKPIPDLYALYLRKFHGFDDRSPLPEDPDDLLRESRLQFGRWFDDTRIVADLKFVTATSADSVFPNAVEDLHEGITFTPGGNYGSVNTELLEELAHSGLQLVGDFAYWYSVGWIIEQLSNRD